MDQIAQSVIKEIATCCGLEVDRVSREAWLAEYGIDSVKSMDMLMDLEDRYEIEITDQEISEMVKVSDVIALMQKKVNVGTPK